MSTTVSAGGVALSYEGLLARQRALGADVRSAVDLVCAGEPALRRAVSRLLELDESAVSPFRLLPFPLLGALGGEPVRAVPVCVISRLWWAGAEILDDVMDRQFADGDGGLTASQATVAAAVCLTLIPQELLHRQGFPPAVHGAWSRELTRASMAAADGQFDDVEAGAEGVTWRRVMAGYAGKSGSAYGRDAALTALLAGVEGGELRGFRAFGRLFGVLRQMANDRAPRTAAEDADLANGTRTLLLAHAAESLPPAEASRLLEAHRRAGSDPAARRLVWDRLRRRDVADGYDERVAVIRRRLSELLERLVPPCPERELIQWMVDLSAGHARLAAEAADPAEQEGKPCRLHPPSCPSTSNGTGSP